MAWMSNSAVFGVDTWHRFGVSWEHSKVTPPSILGFSFALDQAGFDVQPVTSPLNDSVIMGVIKPRLAGLTMMDFHGAVLGFSPSGVAVESDAAPGSPVALEWADYIKDKLTILPPDNDEPWFMTYGPILIGVAGLGVAVYALTRK